MSLFANLASDSSIENEKDSVGSSFGPVDSGLYTHEITLAYVQMAASGAMGIVLHLKDVNSGHEHRETQYVTSGNAKGNKNYYETKDGDKKYLPGFNNINSLCLLTVGKELAQIAPEEKVINLYNPEAKKEVPTKVQVLTEILGKQIITGLLKSVVDKNVKQPDGSYKPSGETREINEIDKFFRERDKMTTAEIRAGSNEAVFYNQWDEKNSGKTRTKTTKAANDSNGATGTVAFGGNTKPTQSLFG
jgi:hypothetical protein